MDQANNNQVGGTHYTSKAIKYVSRWKDKGGIEDLRKARHYLDKLIEVNLK